MAREKMPINPEVLSWARERAGYSVQTATKIHPEVGAWESGDGQPTYPQLEMIANAFRVPVAVFFFPDPPDVPPIEETFRTLGSKQFETIPPRIHLLLRKARALQISLEELYERNPSENVITREQSYKDKKVATIATDLREKLDVSIEQQFSWEKPEIALHYWREAFFNAGVYVFKDQFRNDDYCGFCLHHEEFPIVYINNTNSKTRQIFTMFHELAHLLFHTSGIDMVDDGYIESLPKNSQRIETLCNKLAADFLVPEAALLDQLNGRNVTRDIATELADRFVVSREVIYRRFLDRKLVNKADFDRAIQFWKSQKRENASGGGNYYYNKIAYLGEEYIMRAFQAYHKGHIDEELLADYLDTSPKNVSRLEDYFIKRVG